MAPPSTSSARRSLRSSPRGAARAYRVDLRHGWVVTTQLATRYLGDAEVVPLVGPIAAIGEA